MAETGDDVTTGDLVLALPSKGRLQEHATTFFARAGLTLTQGSGARDYRGRLVGVPNVEVRFLSASDITGQLASGAVHMGITGEDLIRETLPDAARQVELLMPLGFGHADVVVAVPQAWIDVRAMSDLDEVAAEMRLRHGTRMRVATKYVNLTRQFFSEHGVADYRVVESLGATEGAPATGSAEIVVDITTTGATLAANALKILDDGVILQSQANLVASLIATWGLAERTALRLVMARITAEEKARAIREVRGVVRHRNTHITLADIATTHRSHISYGTLLEPGEVILHCPGDDAFNLAAALVEAGVDHVTVRRIDYVLSAESPIADRLLSKLGETT